MLPLNEVLCLYIQAVSICSSSTISGPQNVIFFSLKKEKGHSSGIQRIYSWTDATRDFPIIPQKMMIPVNACCQ